MTSPTPVPRRFTTFDGHRRIASGPLPDNALALRRALDHGAAGPVLVFDDSTGRSIDLDTSGTVDEMLERSAVRAAQLAAPQPVAGAGGKGGDAPETAEPRGRGRPRLGVVSREVTLLPRHWEWLAAQPGGASVALRKLVEQARRDHAGKDRSRAASERAYHFMVAIAGDLAGFEEASRALFANDLAGFARQIADWPVDVREHALRLADSSA
ncbi:DUF2239 family protein [Cupriavidus neocaledonicus]|uniref:DUF2239 domain-containing protein n=1 Tax=Cupriavidus neocaledonicus TaxID=1040979 RepID=A0A375H8Z9_9BURK|nr:DUF2239 family protein [Cupriavidus neocaledonicus]SOZ34980.1 conserved hypothetical protein, COG3644 [Cupriavidus neocaledonicus]SPD46923.1 conserved protein of unknown function [Cupriavidus neocaledonicus]